MFASDSKYPADSLRALAGPMLQHLAALPSTLVPGGDGLTIGNAIDLYLRLAANGVVPTLERLRQRMDADSELPQRSKLIATN